MTVQCKNCVRFRDDWCEWVHDSPDPELDRECFVFKQATNGDKIRAMPDEDLAKWLCWEVDGSGKAGMEWLDWLQSPMEVEDG